MEDFAKEIKALEAAIMQANGRRRKRILLLEDIIKTKLEPHKQFKIVRDFSVDPPFRKGRFYIRRKPGKATAALIFRVGEEKHVILKALPTTAKNGFTELVWGSKLRTKVDPFKIKGCKVCWVPEIDELQIYSDYLEEHGLKRIA